MQAKTLLIEMPEEFWRLVEILAASQDQQPYSITKIIETSLQLGLAVQLELIAAISPAGARDVSAAMASADKHAEFIQRLHQRQEGESHEYKP